MDHSRLSAVLKDENTDQLNCTKSWPRFPFYLFIFGYTGSSLLCCLGFSLVAASRGYPQVAVQGLLIVVQLLLLWSKGSRHKDSVVVQRLSCPTICVIREDTLLQRASFPEDFKDHLVQPPFDFPVYSISSKWLFILNQNKKRIIGVKKKPSRI